MRYLLVIIFLTGCSTFAWKDPTSQNQMNLIKNHRTCTTDLDCRDGEMCGFVYVDTVAVCKNVSTFNIIER